MTLLTFVVANQFEKSCEPVVPVVFLFVFSKIFAAVKIFMTFEVTPLRVFLLIIGNLSSFTLATHMFFNAINHKFSDL